MLPVPQPDENFWTMLGTEALNYDIPDSESDTEAVEKLQSLFDRLDDYTGLYIYGLEDGIYRAGQYPRCMGKERFRSFFDIGYSLTGGVTEQRHERNTEFKNGYATVIVTFYHSSIFIFPYFLFSLFVSVSLFLLILLFFINRKMKQVVLLKCRRDRCSLPGTRPSPSHPRSEYPSGTGSTPVQPGTDRRPLPRSAHTADRSPRVSGHPAIKPQSRHAEYLCRPLPAKNR